MAEMSVPGTKARILLVSCGLSGFFGMASPGRAQVAPNAPIKVRTALIKGAIDSTMSRSLALQFSIVDMLLLRPSKKPITPLQNEEMLAALADYAVDQGLIKLGDTFDAPKSPYAMTVVSNAREDFKNEAPEDRDSTDIISSIASDIGVDGWCNQDGLLPTPITLKRAEEEREAKQFLVERFRDILDGLPVQSRSLKQSRQP